MSRYSTARNIHRCNLAILAAGVFVIGSKEYLFRSTYHLKAHFDNVAGLAAGADVKWRRSHTPICTSHTTPSICTGASRWHTTQSSPSRTPWQQRSECRTHRSSLARSWPCC